MLIGCELSSRQTKKNQQHVPTHQHTDDRISSRINAMSGLRAQWWLVVHDHLHILMCITLLLLNLTVWRLCCISNGSVNISVLLSLYFFSAVVSLLETKGKLLVHGSMPCSSSQYSHSYRCLVKRADSTHNISTVFVKNDLLCLSFPWWWMGMVGPGEASLGLSLERLLAEGFTSVLLRLSTMMGVTKEKQGGVRE